MENDRPTLEIEITPAMIEAGAKAGWHEGSPPPIAYSLAERIFKAMWNAREIGDQTRLIRFG